MSPTALSLVMPRFRPRSVQAMLESLEKAGLVRLCRASTVGLVEGWSHQKIDKPRSSNWKGKEIQWDAVSNSPKPRRKVATNRRKDRIGEDRIGEDIPSGEVARNAPPALVPNSKDLIALYCNLWKAKYKSERSPDIRGKTAGQIVGLAKDLGHSRAETLVTAYLQMNDQWFLTKTHDIPTLLGNLPKVALFADSGQLVTKTLANQIDQSTALREQMKRLGGEK